MGKFSATKSHKHCCVPQCNSRYTYDISLFFFPKDEAMRKRWADAIKTEKRVTQHMQVCSRHFTKNDYMLSEYPNTTKVRRLKKSAVPTQNLPWQFPNKRVSPTLAKARMERLKNRTQQKTSNKTGKKTEANKQKEPEIINSPPRDVKSENEQSIVYHESVVYDDHDPLDNLLDQDSETMVKDESEVVSSASIKDLVQQLDKNTERAEIHTDTEEKKEEVMLEGAPTRLRQREGLLKCELCGRKCLTPQALRTHQQIAHKHVKIDHMDSELHLPETNKPKEPAKPIPVALISIPKQVSLPEPKLVPKINNAEKPSKISSLVERVLLDDDSDTSDSEITYSSEGTAKTVQLKPEKKDRTKIEFECPKCKKRFAVLFTATKHVQKHHLGGLKDKFQTTLPPELKPVRIEICTICNTTLTSSMHLCAGPLKLANGFVCTGCGQDFRSLMLFDAHKSGMHNEGVESMFFPKLDEFESWKLKMQRQTRASYSVLDQNDTKQVHRCSHVVHAGAGARGRSHMCPSSVVVQEFPKGFQVHYYPNHYGHEFSPYNLSKAFSKYSIASLMNVTASKLPDDSDDEDLKETDLYLQFKRLTELLVNDAARINVRGLKILMRKALDMVSVVNNYNEDEDAMTLSDNDDDLEEQVKSALRGFKKPHLKRPSSTLEPSVMKRSKPVFQSTENTLKANVKSNAVIKIKEEMEDVSEKKVNEQKTQSPSFIDTFQEFVGKSRESPGVKRRPRADARPNGQRGKKVIVKTKMGQFKQSPKKKSVSPTPSLLSASRTSIGSVKDVEYEVKEQENDCNILILKI